MYNKYIFSGEDLFMNYRTKNMRNAILTFIALTVGFYFFFGQKWLIVALAIGAFLSVSMFFNPNKLDKLKREEGLNKERVTDTTNLDPKEISEEDLENLDLDNVDGLDLNEDSDK